MINSLRFVPKFLLILSLLTTSCLAIIKNDIESHWQVGLIKEFKKDLIFQANTQYRRVKKEDINYLHTEFGLTKSLHPKRVDLSAFYRAITEDVAGIHRLNHRMYLNLIFKGKAKKFILSNTFGLEYRARQKTNDLLLAKGTIKIGYKTKANGVTIQPYISNTLSIDVAEKSSHRNLLYLGLVTKQKNDIFLDFYYYWESYWKHFTPGLNNSYYVGLRVMFFLPENKKKTSKVRKSPHLTHIINH